MTENSFWNLLWLSNPNRWIKPTVTITNTQKFIKPNVSECLIERLWRLCCMARSLCLISMKRNFRAVLILSNYSLNNFNGIFPIIQSRPSSEQHPPFSELKKQLGEEVLKYNDEDQKKVKDIGSFSIGVTNVARWLCRKVAIGVHNFHSIFLYSSGFYWWLRKRP